MEEKARELLSNFPSSWKHLSPSTATELRDTYMQCHVDDNCLTRVCIHEASRMTRVVGKRRKLGLRWGKHPTIPADLDYPICLMKNRARRSQSTVIREETSNQRSVNAGNCNRLSIDGRLWKGKLRNHIAAPRKRVSRNSQSNDIPDPIVWRHGVRLRILDGM